MTFLVKIEDIENRIIAIRKQSVLLDSDIANLYGVSTKEVNQAVKNNPDKIPNGYIFTLSNKEKTEVVKNFDHLQKLKYSPQGPKAFTEKRLF